jgi:hypothetical protein
MDNMESLQAMISLNSLARTRTLRIMETKKPKIGNSEEEAWMGWQVLFPEHD